MIAFDIVLTFNADRWMTKLGKLEVKKSTHPKVRTKCAPFCIGAYFLIINTKKYLLIDITEKFKLSEAMAG